MLMMFKWIYIESEWNYIELCNNELKFGIDNIN